MIELIEENAAKDCFDISNDLFLRNGKYKK